MKKELSEIGGCFWSRSVEWCCNDQNVKCYIDCLACSLAMYRQATLLRVRDIFPRKKKYFIRRISLKKVSVNKLLEKKMPLIGGYEFEYSVLLILTMIVNDNLLSMVAENRRQR